MATEQEPLSAAQMDAMVQDQLQRETDSHYAPPGGRPSRSRRRRNGHDFTTRFWDDLSEIVLTPRALQQIAYQKRLLSKPGPRPAKRISVNLARFASNGGPDLTHLRGYPNPSNVGKDVGKETSHQVNGEVIAVEDGGEEMEVDELSDQLSLPVGPRPPSVFEDNNSEQHLIDYGVFPEDWESPDNTSKPLPSNFDVDRPLIYARRPSLSYPYFRTAFYTQFERICSKVDRDRSSVTGLLSMICGQIAPRLCEGPVRFDNYELLTGEPSLYASPDYFDGLESDDMHRHIKIWLDEVVIPSKHKDLPAAPNFFVEVRKPGEHFGTAKKRACLHGAYGVRAMECLRTYGIMNPNFDEVASTFSAVFSSESGSLQLFMHHLSPPSKPDGHPECHMTQVKQFLLAKDVDQFRDGVNAFRNMRALAARFRSYYLRQANERARKGVTALVMPSIERDEARAVHISSLHEVHHPAEELQEDYSAQQEADDALQQSIMETTEYDLDMVDAVEEEPEPEPPHRQHTSWNPPEPALHYPYTMYIPSNAPVFSFDLAAAEKRQLEQVARSQQQIDPDLQSSAPSTPQEPVLQSQPVIFSGSGLSNFPQSPSQPSPQSQPSANSSSELSSLQESASPLAQSPPEVDSESELSAPSDSPSPPSMSRPSSSLKSGLSPTATREPISPSPQPQSPMPSQTQPQTTPRTRFPVTPHSAPGVTTRARATPVRPLTRSAAAKRAAETSARTRRYRG